MAKSDWKDCEITIDSPDGTESLCFKIPIHGQEHTNMQLIMKYAFKNAANLLKDADAVSSYSRIILCSLSCELFLKAIIIKTQNKKIRGHDIYELYFELGDKERNQLLDAFVLRGIASDEDDIDLKISEGIADFEKSLMLDAFLFETIRYKHEYDIIIYDENFIYNFAHDLKKLGEDLGLSE